MDNQNKKVKVLLASACGLFFILLVLIVIQAVSGKTGLIKEAGKNIIK